ncbi:MAG: hypothetical protein DMD64_15555 [Gemmatimonadetes bacterium]|nr:MAG: hypothetical protein DMD64_15555 [Gemmatimonadota bacterium]
MVGGMFRRWSVLLVTMLAAFHPAVASAQGRGWRWFQSCSTPTTMVLEARLDSASAFRTTFPACFLDKASWNTKVLRFHFTPGRAVEWPNASVWRDGDERRFAATTSAGRTLVAQIYEQGTNTSGSILGIAIGTKDSVTPLDTVLWRGAHNASATDQVLTELVPGLVLVTYPLGWQPKPLVRVDTTWCAPPRPNEPLLLDAQFLPARGKNRTGTDSDFVNLASLSAFGVRRVPRDSIAIIRDEAVCRRIARQHGNNKPMLIVRVGSFYLADDQGSRDGPSPLWEVAVYDRNWRLLISYGEGQ